MTKPLNLTPNPTIGKFLDYIRLELNYSEHTVASYGRDLRRWSRWATRGTDLELDPLSVTVSDLRLYVASMSRGRMAVSTIHRHIQSIRAFYKFLMREGMVKANPAADLQLARMPRSLPVYVRQQEMETVLDMARPGSDADPDFAQMRDYALVLALYSTGMRVSEMCGLTDGDVDTSRGELRVRGKRDKERLIPFGPELAQVLERYRHERDAHLGAEPGGVDAPLFVRDDGTPMDRKTAYRLVHSMLSQGGAHAARLSPHVLRHCFATDMLNGGADLTSVRRLLGHASLASTQIYTHVSFSQMKQAYASAHPRGAGRKQKTENKLPGNSSEQTITP